MYFEPVSKKSSLKEAENSLLIVEDLFKEYPNGFKAVNGVNLKLYQD